MKKFITMIMKGLQLFANEVQTTLLGDLSAEMKTFYDMTLIDEARPTWSMISSVRSVPSPRTVVRPSSSVSSLPWQRPPLL